MPTRSFAPTPPTSRAMVARWILLGLFGTVALCAGWPLVAPTGLRYEIVDRELIVQVRQGIWLEADRIATADLTRADTADLAGGFGTVGSALSGLCTGEFQDPEHGRVWRATPCGDRGVVLHVTGRDLPIVLGPADPHMFIEALRRGRAGIYPAQAPPAPRTGWRITLAITLVLALLRGGHLLLGARRLRYYITGRTLTIQGAFTRSQIRLSGCRARRDRPDRSSRILELASPSLYTSWLRLDGVWTRVAATRLDRGVLIEGAGIRIFVTPQREGRFFKALASARVSVPPKDT